MRQRLLLVILLMCAAGSVAAQTSLLELPVQDFTAPDRDASLSLIQQILGEPRAGHKTLFTAPLYILNLAALSVAVILFSYTAIVGLLQSAHDGVLLGKKWSSVWVPFRFGVGVALIVPTTTGLSLGQHGILWGVDQGVAIASTAWRSAVTNYASTGNIYIAARSADAAEVRLAITEIMKAEMCVARMNKFGLAEPVATRMISYGSDTYIARAAGFFGRDFNGGRIEWGVPPNSGTGYRSDLCGAVEIPNTQNINPLIKTHAVADGFGHAQIEALMHAAEKIEPVVTECLDIKPHEPPCSSQLYVDALDRATTAYTNYIATHFDEIVRQQNARLLTSVERDADTYGWLTAGWHYFQLARVTGDMNASVMSVPSVQPMQPAPELEMIDGHAEHILSTYTKQGDHATRLFYARTPTNPGGNLQDIDTSAGGSLDRNRITDGVRSISHLIFGIDSNAATDSSRHFGYDPNNPAPAVIQLKTLGDYLMGIGTTGLAAIGVVSAGKKIASNSGPKGKILSAILGVSDGATKSAALLFGLMMISGALLALWLPMIPFVIWLGQTVGWFLSVFEMLIAAPIWLAAHLHPEGDGVSSRQAANGYIILVEVIARPILMLLGLCIAMVAIDPLLSLVAIAFYPFFGTIIADAQAQPITLVFKIGAYAALSLIVMNMVFKAITEVPNNVMKWIGGMTDSHNSMGNTLTDTARTVAIAGAVRSTSMGSTAIRSLRANAGSVDLGGNSIRPR